MLKRSTQNDFIYGEMGRMCLQKYRLFIIIKYWIRILHSGDNKYIKKIYLMLKNDCETIMNRINWCSLIRNALYNLDFGDAWLYQSKGDVKMFLKVVKQIIKDQLIQDWHSRLNDSSRAFLYRSICDFRFQPYLDTLTINKYRNSFSRLRTSSHRLAIETGRWAKPISKPICERVCFSCKLIEDEFHFILECNIYTEVRQQYIRKYYRERPNMFKSVQLLKSENK